MHTLKRHPIVTEKEVRRGSVVLVQSDDGRHCVLVIVTFYVNSLINFDPVCFLQGVGCGGVVDGKIVWSVKDYALRAYQ
jgi:hypothetical protein